VESCNRFGRLAGRLKLKQRLSRQIAIQPHLPMTVIRGEEILQSAYQRLKLYQQKRFARIVSVGDGVWDVHAARNRGLLLGDGAGDREENCAEAERSRY